MKALLFALVVVLGSASAVHAVQATLNWTNPAGGAAATNIRVDRGDGPDPVTFVQQGALLAPGITTFNQSGLVLGTRYCFRVVPVNSFGGNNAAAPVACGTPDTPLGVNGLSVIFAP